MNKPKSDGNGNHSKSSNKYNNSIAMFRANPDVIFRLKADGSIIDLHVPPKSLILPIESFQNANIKDVLTPKQGVECLKLIDKARKSEEVQLFNHFTVHQGKKFYFDGRIVRNDEDDDVIMIVRDVTSQKNAELLNDILYKIAVKSSSDHVTTQSFCKYIEEQLSRLIDVTEFYIAISDGEDHVTFIHLKDSKFKETIPHIRKNGNGLTEYVLNTGKSLIIKGNEVNKFRDQLNKTLYGSLPKCWVGAPIMLAGKSIGVIACLSYTNENLYNQFDLDFLTTVGNQIGLWIERKRSEEERVSFNRIFEKSLNEIYIFDIETFRFKYVNEGARKNLGYTNEEVLSLTPIDIKDEFDFESFSKTIAPLKEGKNEILRFETKHTRNDGSHYPVEIHLQCSYFNGAKAFISMVLDVSERKQAEKTIKEREVQFKSLADNAPNHIVKLDKNLCIKYINRGALGYTVKEMLGKSAINFIYPSNVADIKMHLNNVFKTGESTFYETSRINEDGSIMYLHTQVGPIIDDENQVTSLILIIQDITQETLAKQKVESSFNELKLIDKINQASIENKPLDELINLTMNALSEEIDLVGSRFYLYDETKDELELTEERIETSLLKKLEHKIGLKLNSIIPSLKKGSSFYEAIHNQSIIIGRTKKDILKIVADHTDNLILKTFSKWAGSMMNIKTFVVIPLVSNKVIFGLVTLTSDKDIEDGEIDKIKRFTNGITASLAKSLTENEIKKQKQFTEDLLNNLPADIAVFTPDHKYQFVNKLAIREENMRKWIIGKDDFDYCEKRGIDFSLAEKRSKLFVEASKQHKGVEWIDNHVPEDKEHQYILRKLFPIIKDDILNYVVGFGIDITERKIAENQLIDSEERYRSLFEQMNEGLILLSTDGIIQMVNPKMAEITGYKESEIIGTNGLFLNGENADITALKERRRRQKEGITDKYTSEIITKTGDKIWVTYSVSPQYDRNGVFVGSMSIVNDITDERKAEIASSIVYNIATKVSSEELNLLELCKYIQHELGRYIDTTNFYICLEKDSDTIDFPFHIDAKTIQGSSFSRKKNNGMSEYILSHGKNLLFNGDELLDFLKENKLKMHGANPKSWIGAPIFIKNNVIGVIACQSYEKAMAFDSTHLDLLSYVGRQVGMFIDQIKSEKSKQEFTQNLASMVAERTSELEISQNESKYQLDTLNEIALVSIADISGKITYANSLFCSVSGYSEEELMGQSHRILKSENQPDELFVELWKTISSGQIWKGEINNKMKNGEFYWVDTTIVPFFDVNGKIEKYVSVRFDITQKKELLNQLESSLEKEKKLGELKSRFVSTASHQFRTPMTIIQSNSELLDIITRNADEGLKLKLGKATTRIKAEIKRMTSLMDEILILGKISAGKMVAKKAPASILTICVDLCEKYDSIQIDNRSVDFSVFGKDKIVNIDSKLMDHSISNLLSNAFKYSQEENPRLELIFELDQFVIHVKDNGIGIPENEKEDLFHPFHRAINVGEIPGTGLGLTIVKDYIELNNGSVSIQSREGEETIFTIEIPYT